MKTNDMTTTNNNTEYENLYQCICITCDLLYLYTEMPYAVGHCKNRQFNTAIDPDYNPRTYLCSDYETSIHKKVRAEIETELLGENVLVYEIPMWTPVELHCYYFKQGNHIHLFFAYNADVYNNNEAAGTLISSFRLTLGGMYVPFPFNGRYKSLTQKEMDDYVDRAMDNIPEFLLEYEFIKSKLPLDNTGEVNGRE